MSGSSGPPRLDARLVPCAAAAWAVTILGLYTGARPAAGAAAVAAGAALVIAGRGRPRRRALARVVLAALTVTAGFGASAAVRMWFVEHHPLAAAAADGGWATVAITPTDDPRPLRRDAFDGTPQVRLPARLHHVTVAGRPIATGGSVVVFAPADSWGDLLPGQRIGARVRLAAPSGPGTTVAMLRADGAPRTVAPPPIWQRWAGVVRDRFAAACRGALPPAQAGLLPGLVVGDTSALTDEVREDFRVAGLAHLTAVSGDMCTLAGVSR